MLAIVAVRASETLAVFQITSITRGILTLAAGGLISALLVKMFHRPPVVLLVPILFSAYTGHSVEVIACLVFLSASFCLGSLLERLLGVETDAWFGPILPFLKLLTGLFLNSLLTWGAMHLPINHSAGYWAFYGLEIIVCAVMHGLPRPTPTKRWTGGQWLVFFHFLLFLPYALVPSYNHDDVAAHLFIPKQTRIFGEVVFTPEVISTLNPSMLPMGAYTSVFMLSGEVAVRLLNLSMYTLGFLLLECFARRRWGNRVSFLTTLFAVVTPFTHWTLGICFVDSFLFVYSTLFVVVTSRFLTYRQLSVLPLLGLLAGIGYLAKQQIIFVIIPLSLPILIIVARELWRAPTRTLSFTSLATLVFCGTISPPLIHNYILSGNPLFPFYNSIFKSPYWPAEDLVDTRWNQPFSIETVWTITFHGSRFVENHDFSFGFGLLVLLPAILTIGGYRAARKEAWIFGLLLLCVSCAYVCYSTTGLYIRYLVGLIAPLSLCLGLTANELLCRSRLVVWLTTVLVSLLIAGNFGALLSGRHTAEPYPIIESVTGSLEQSSMAYCDRFKKLFQKGRHLCGRNSLGLLLDSPGNYFAQTRLISNSWHFPQVSMKLASTNSTEELAAYVFDQQKVCYIIMPVTPSPSGVGSPEFRKLLRIVGKTADFGLFVPKKTP